MSFEHFCECFNGMRRGPQFHRESVPMFHVASEVTAVDDGPCTRHNECPAVRRPQLPPADDGRRTRRE